MEEQEKRKERGGKRAKGLLQEEGWLAGKLKGEGQEKVGWDGMMDCFFKQRQMVRASEEIEREGGGRTKKKVCFVCQLRSQ